MFQGGSIVGTTPYVAGDTDYVITVERSNNYGTTSQTFTLTITDNLLETTASLSTGVRPAERMILTNDALIQYDTVLNEDQQITWSQRGRHSAQHRHPQHCRRNGTGQLRSGHGRWAPQASPLSAVGSSRFVTFGGYIGASSEKYTLTGWADNVTQPGAEGINFDVEFKLVYEVDAQRE